MSEALVQRIAVMKAKAEMMREMECALEKVCERVREFGEEVERALPPSPQLESRQEEILHRQVREEGVKLSKFRNKVVKPCVKGQVLLSQAELCERCRKEMTGLNNLFDRFSTSPELEIPARITDRAATARNNFEARKNILCCFF